MLFQNKMNRDKPDAETITFLDLKKVELLGWEPEKKYSNS